MIMDDFDARKAAQIAAYFARAQGGRINVLKLVKLIYLADREFAVRYGEPMLDDRWVSMDHGPVNSGTYDMVNGVSGPNADWDAFIGPRQGVDVPVARPLSDNDLDDISDTERGVLSEMWDRFGHMSQYQVRDYTHRHCPEWENPHGSSAPIPYERLFRHLGNEYADDLAENIEAMRSLNRTFKRTADAARKLVRPV
jgi:uncharacterized phage-associated protein